jgi:hypothetical protein
LGKYENALKDVENAQKLGTKVDPSYVQKLKEAAANEK